MSGSSGGSGGDLEARLQRVEDLQAIQQLFVDYGQYLDAGNFDAYASLFADDGEVLLGPLGRAQGRENIKALMTKTLEGQAGSSYHLITSPVVALDGDSATATVMWTVIARDANGAPELTMVGRHVDELVRQPDGWKFRRRKGFIDLPSRYPPG
jgi:uncharacterized protein (TIGR02246 family)